MKRTYTLLAILVSILLAGCAGSDKLMDKGNYDAAFNKAVRKIHKKNKGGKYRAMAIEAFEKANKRDILLLQKTIKANDPKSWVNAYNLLCDLERRQKKVMAKYLHESIDLKNENIWLESIYELKNQAATESAKYYYNEALPLLEDGRHGNKEQARKAYNLFQKAERYKRNYEDLYELKRESEKLGTVNVLISVGNDSYNYILNIEDDVLDAVIDGIDNQNWVCHYTYDDRSIDFNYELLANIREARITRTSSEERSRKFTKSVKKKVVDTAGNVTYKYKNVYATVWETERVKRVEFEVDLILYEMDTGRRVNTECVRSIKSFSDKCYTSYTGDRRALPKDFTIRKADRFPSRNEMIRKGLYDLKHKIECEVPRFKRYFL